jgi:hypothetical protein
VQEACKSCRFLMLDTPRDELGFCRRFPPLIVQADEEMNFTFPVVAINEWCGEYRGPEQ